MQTAELTCRYSSAGRLVEVRHNSSSYVI